MRIFALKFIAIFSLLTAAVAFAQTGPATEPQTKPPIESSNEILDETASDTSSEQDAKTYSSATTTPDVTSAPDIVDLAHTDERFSVLASAIEAASLSDTLRSEGPFTVFAPTNYAFSLIGQEKLKSMMEESNQEALTSVLTYHVVQGELSSETIMDNIESEGGNFLIQTINGNTLKAVVADGNLYLIDGAGNPAMVETADVKASNGVIHALNAVVMPSE